MENFLKMLFLWKIVFIDIFSQTFLYKIVFKNFRFIKNISSQYLT